MRSVTDVGKGDFVKVGSTWKEIDSNPAQGDPRAARSNTVQTTDGGSYGLFGINRYAKAEDLE